MNLEIIGDEIWFGPWKLGRKPDAMPATQWDQCIGDVAVADAEKVEADMLAAVKAREEELDAEMLDLQKDLDATRARIAQLEAEDLHDDKVQAMKRELKRRTGK